MHERYKTLGAVLALGEFSVSELAELAGVREPTVRTILRREGTFVEQIGRQSTGQRGGQPVRWRLRSAAREPLRAQLEELERLGAGPWLTDQYGHETSRAGIIAAEDVLLRLASTAANPVERAELIRLAEAQLDAADAKMSQSDDTQVSKADRPLERDKRIVELLLTLQQAEQDATSRRDRILQEASVQAKELTLQARYHAEELEHEAQRRYRRARKELSAIQDEITALTRRRDELVKQTDATAGEWMPSLAAYVASTATDVFAYGQSSGGHEGAPSTISGRSTVRDRDRSAKGTSAVRDRDRRADKSTVIKGRRKRTASEFRAAEVTNRTTWISDYLRRAALADLACATIAVFGVFQVRAGSHISIGLLVFALVLPVLWVGSLALAGGYDSRFIGTGFEEFRRILNAAVVLTAALAVFTYLIKSDTLRWYVAVTLPCVLALDLIARFGLRKLLHRWWRRGRCMRRAVAVGHAALVADLATLLRRDSRHGLSVVAACVVGPPHQDEVADIPTYDGLDSVASVVSRFNADTVAVLASPEINGTQLRELAWDLEKTGTEMVVASALLDAVGPRTTMRPVAGLPLLHVDHAELTGAKWVIKGLFDRVSAAAALLFLAPILLSIAFFIRVADGGPVFFRETRIGKDGRQFTLYKFRTMVVDSEARKDPQVTSVGKSLRRLSLDELPQLINVLRGDMSLVGSRPPLPNEVEQYTDYVRRRLVVKPGFTGLWNVVGRSDLSWEEAVRLDVRYVENWSLTLDLQILWRTVLSLARGSG